MQNAAAKSGISALGTIPIKCVKARPTAHGLQLVLGPHMVHAQLNKGPWLTYSNSIVNGLNWSIRSKVDSVAILTTMFRLVKDGLFEPSGSHVNPIEVLCYPFKVGLHSVAILMDFTICRRAVPH